MIYLDSSAILKLIVEEQESAALEAWLDERAGMSLVSSELVRTEVVRAVRRLDAKAVPVARALVTQLDLVPLGSVLLEQAADVGGPALRSLDALHLAAALSLGEDLSEFAAYDHRLAAAAQSVGLAVTMPGAQRTSG